jgi:hypothetical protein
VKTSGAASSSFGTGLCGFWEWRHHGGGLGGGGGPPAAPCPGSRKRDGEAGDDGCACRRAGKPATVRATGDMRSAPEAAGERRFFRHGTHGHLRPFYASGRRSRDSLSRPTPPSPLKHGLLGQVPVIVLGQYRTVSSLLIRC